MTPNALAKAICCCGVVRNFTKLTAPAMFFDVAGMPQQLVKDSVALGARWARRAAGRPGT